MLNKNNNQICELCGFTTSQYVATFGHTRIEKCLRCGLMWRTQIHNDTPASNNLSLHEDTQLDYQQIRNLGMQGDILLFGFENEQIVELAQESNIRLIAIHDMTALENLSGQFDGAIIHYALEKSKHPVRLLMKIHEMLKLDAPLLVSSISLNSYPKKIFQQDWIGWQFTDNFYFDNQTIQSMLWHCGFNRLELAEKRHLFSLAHIDERLQNVQTVYASFISFIARLLPSKLLHSIKVELPTSGFVISARKSSSISSPQVSIVMPVYNEVATVEQAIQAVLNKELPNIKRELLIIESNSTDGSREVVETFADHPDVRVIFEDRPRGKGHAVRKGLEAVEGHIILIQDADLEYDVNDYDDLLAPLLNYEASFVLGSRHQQNWKMRQFTDMPLLSLIYNSGHIFFLTLFNILYRQSLKDPFTMYKVFRSDCIHNLKFECNRFDFDFELVIKLIRKGYQPKEIPVNYRSRSHEEGKKVSIYRDPITWIKALIKYRFASIYRSDA